MDKGKGKDKPTTPVTPDEDKQKTAGSQKEKLERVKEHLTKTAEGKAKRAEERKKKREKEKAGKKQTLSERMKDKLRFITNIFQGEPKAEKAKKRALSNMSNKRVGDVGTGDITYTGAGGHGKYDGAMDCWIEDPSMLTNTQHRDDLLLVENNDNEGQLFHEGKRPFWKNQLYAKEHPPLPEEKPSSALLVKVVNEGGKQLAASVDPPDEFDWTEVWADLQARDATHFKEEHMLANTIRSVINTMYDAAQASSDRFDPSSKRALKTMPESDTREMKITEPPAEMTCYNRHICSQTKKEPFRRSTPGKPKKLKEKEMPAGAAGGKSPSGSSSSSDSDKK